MLFDGWAIVVVLLFAIWPMLLLAAARFGRRFSLLRMLVAVAVVAVVLGAIAFVTRG